MEVLCYYKNQKRISLLELHRDFRIRTLGSFSENDYVLDDDEVDAVHLKMRFQNGFYQLMAAAPLLMEEDINLPLNTWIDMPAKKKLWFQPGDPNSHVVFMDNVVVHKITKQIKQVKAHAEHAPASAEKVPADPGPVEDEEHPQGVGAEQQTAISHFRPLGELDLAPDPVLDQDDTLYDGHNIVAEGPKIEEKGLKIEGRYQVLRMLGKGGMGVVYKVLDEKIQRVVALKLLSAKDKCTLEAIQRFVSEARSMARLRHKNIVRVYDNGIHEGLPYFTMDFVEGKELQKCLDNIKPRTAMRWIVSVCEAVHYFHQLGLIHRDLKPSNIMIGDSGEPVLMDFGIARDETSRSVLTAAGQSIGTPAYMAPEQARGIVDKIDQGTDVYGLGAILYEMLTRRPPFIGAPMQVLYKVCNEDPPSVLSINPQVPKDIVTIVDKAMAKEKIFRYDTAEEMASDIRRYLEGLRIHAQPPSLAMRMLRKLRQNRTYAYLGLACSVLLIFLTSMLWYSHHQAAVGRANKIRQNLEEAAAFMKNADATGSKSISDYIQALERYTKVLGLDTENALARAGKFKCLWKMGEYAEHRDSNFARTMYNNALEMDIDNATMQKRLKDLQGLKKREKQEMQARVKEAFQCLAQ